VSVLNLAADFSKNSDRSSPPKNTRDFKLNKQPVRSGSSHIRGLMHPRKLASPAVVCPCQVSCFMQEFKKKKKDTGFYCHSCIFMLHFCVSCGNERRNIKKNKLKEQSKIYEALDESEPSRQHGWLLQFQFSARQVSSREPILECIEKKILRSSR
jgi:hypothetical protein